MSTTVDVVLAAICGAVLIGICAVVIAVFSVLSAVFSALDRLSARASSALAAKLTREVDEVADFFNYI